MSEENKTNFVRIYGIFDQEENTIVYVSLSYTDVEIEMTSLSEERFVPCEFDIVF